ncbi:MAG: hypothetical protein FJ399_20150 [Verrucomicrobia bacterium]|nr:hypothetical protein [Verrucomicrobiota bacterium]
MAATHQQRVGRSSASRVSACAWPPVIGVVELLLRQRSGAVEVDHKTSAKIHRANAPAARARSRAEDGNEKN